MQNEREKPSRSTKLRALGGAMSLLGFIIVVLLVGLSSFHDDVQGTYKTAALFFLCCLLVPGLLVVIFSFDEES